MQKAAVMLAAVGAIIAAGIILSFYGSAIITEGLSRDAGRVDAGSTLEVAAELGPAGGEGVYAVQVMEFAEGMVRASVTGPLGQTLADMEVPSESFEGYFEIADEGTYILRVENAGEGTDIVGALGHVPDAAKISVAVTGFYLVIAGMIGMAVAGVYIVRNKRRSV